MSGTSSSEGVLSPEEFTQMAAASAAAKVKRRRRAEPVVPPPTERWGRRHRAQSFIQGKELDELEMEVETGLYENVDISYGSRMPVLLAHICYSEPFVYKTHPNSARNNSIANCCLQAL